MIRFLAGLACMILSAVLVVGSMGMVAARFTGDTSQSQAGLLAVFAGLFAIAGLLMWRWAYKRAPATDEVFAGERGLLLSLMLISSLALGAFMTAMVVQPDFWRGLMAGLAD